MERSVWGLVGECTPSKLAQGLDDGQPFFAGAHRCPLRQKIHEEEDEHAELIGENNQNPITVTIACTRLMAGNLFGNLGTVARVYWLSLDLGIHLGIRVL